jgi:hypothetical protein
MDYEDYGWSAIHFQDLHLIVEEPSTTEQESIKTYDDIEVF